jgi:hypothetical protein
MQPKRGLQKAKNKQWEKLSYFFLKRKKKFKIGIIETILYQADNWIGKSLGTLAKLR